MQHSPSHDPVSEVAMTCRAFVELVTNYVERALDGVPADTIGAHLLGCPACRTYLEQILATIAATRRLGGPLPGCRPSRRFDGQCFLALPRSVGSRRSATAF